MFSFKHKVCFIIILTVKISQIDGFRADVIYNYMTEPELAYYFNTIDRNEIPDFELVYLPTVSALVSDGAEETETEYSFSAFKRPINLKLRRNNLLAPNFKTIVHESDGSKNVFEQTPKSCHFLHQDTVSIAAISACDPQLMQGLIFMDNTTYEINPLTPRLKSLISLQEPLLSSINDSTPLLQPHLIKRAIFSHNYHQTNDVSFPFTEPLISNEIIENRMQFLLNKRASHRPVGGMTLEIAVFFDEAGYKIFAPFYNYSIAKIREMLLAYINGVQALYHHPSLGTSLELVVVRLDIMKKQPSDFPHYGGERSKLLDSFCRYQKDENEEDDDDPDHWDMALYVSGLDFYAYENGRKSGVTMGLATVGGVCLMKYACVIAELGTTNVFGKPYPSAGFTSVYILAHEIGHNLGMHHDGVGNSCPKEGYVMSPSRGTNGETQWSSCSSEIMAKLSWASCLFDSAKAVKELDHSYFMDVPGQTFTAKRQCELLLRDRDAAAAPSQQLSTICYNLQCKTPNRSGYYFSGPALEGTKCGSNKFCFGGDCVSKVPPKPVKVIAGGWGPWKEEKCASGCIKQGMGYFIKRRECNSPISLNTDKGCEGSSVEFGICKDESLCKKRVTVEEYASERCQEFSRLLPELDKKGAGLQAPHENARVWMGCAIFCRSSKSDSFYTPRIELNDLGVSPYFPDGTWCHKEENTNYYCLHHHCLPENFQFSKITSVLHEIGEDIPFSQNARPEIIPPEIKSYLSLDAYGKPMKTVFSSNDLKGLQEKDWESDDYIIVPSLKERYE